METSLVYVDAFDGRVKTLAPGDALKQIGTVSVCSTHCGCWPFACCACGVRGPESEVA